MDADMISQLMTGANMLLAGAVFAATQVLKLVFPRAALTAIGARLMPVLPVILGVVGSVAGISSGKTIGEKVAVGIIAGFTAGHGFKIGKTTVMGKGIDTDGDGVPDAPAPAAEVTLSTTSAPQSDKKDPGEGA
jgi:hypothetical protein